MSAPAFAKSSIYLEGSSIIRCTSKGLFVKFLMLLITGIPKEMLGTNLPSITSICIASAPYLSRFFMSSPSLEKSAESIDGAIFTIFSSSYS